MKRKLFTLIFWSAVFPAFAQGPLSGYIQTGLKENQVLREKNISLEQSLLALKNAKSYFLPEVSFKTDYQTAQGGRQITFPAGDLLNGVYSTLNQLTASNRFPAVSNTDEQLLPNNFYDARVHIAYSLLNTDRDYNKQISKQQVVLQEYEVETYTQELVREIKQAYYNYCASLDAIGIYRDAYVLVGQNLKVNQSLLRNGKGLPANVLRAESEKEAVSAKLIDAENTRVNARNYLNFLINRPLTDSVIFEKQELPDSLLRTIAIHPETGQRSELKRADAALGLSGLVVQKNKKFAVPTLNSFFDMGSQASDFKYNSKSRYYFLGVQLNVPIFSGGRNKNNIRLAELDRSALELQKDQLANNLQLMAENAQNNIRSSLAAVHVTEKQLASAKAYFKLIEKGYNEGTNSLIEYLDARDQLTSSSLKLSISQYNLLTQIADYERQTAVSTLKKSNQKQ
jgi:outer membrane protein